MFFLQFASTHPREHHTFTYEIINGSCERFLGKLII